eukprot:366156-Chlamydomonas_euryale.AAC.3
MLAYAACMLDMWNMHAWQAHGTVTVGARCMERGLMRRAWWTCGTCIHARVVDAQRMHGRLLTAWSV